MDTRPRGDAVGPKPKRSSGIPDAEKPRPSRSKERSPAYAPPWSRHSGLEPVRLRREGSLRRDHPERPVDVVDVELHPLCYRPTEPNAGQPCFLATIFATPRPRHEPVLRRRSGRGSSGLNQRSQPNAACHRESRTNLRSASPTSPKFTMDTCPRPENRKPPVDVASTGGSELRFRCAILGLNQ